MSAISSWLLSIAGVIILSVMTEFVLPEGQMNKYIRVIFSFVILLTIIMPLPKLFGKNIEFSDFLNQTEEVLQEDYLYQINLDKLTTLTEELEQKIDDKNLTEVEISINANILAKELEIYGIYVDMKSQDTQQNRQKILELFEEYNSLKGVEVRFDE